MSALETLLSALGEVDPSPLFAFSLFPYLAFLWWAWRSRRFPPLALLGFVLTLVFVAITIVAALYAQWRYEAVLADVDLLHGGAESFLTLSNLVVLLGFSGVGRVATVLGRSSRGPLERDAMPSEPVQLSPIQAEVIGVVRPGKQRAETDSDPSWDPAAGADSEG